MENQIINLLFLTIVVLFLTIFLDYRDKRKILKHINENFIFSVTFEKHIIGKKYSDTNTTEIITKYFFVKDEIEAEIKADSIFSMKSVKENLHPEKTIEVEFLQDAKAMRMMGNQSK